MDLFGELYEPDESPIEDTAITQIILYLDAPDAKEFKRLAKIAMRDKWPTTFSEEGNISELLFILLKEKYGNENVDDKEGVER